MIRCLSCGAETSNGLALCALCQRHAQTIFGVLPVYFANLARWRPGRAGARPVPGSRVLYDGATTGNGTGDRISDTLDETYTALTTWARMLVDDRPHLARLLDRLSAARSAETITEAEAVTWLCRGFTRYLTSVSTLSWCGGFVHDLTTHEQRLRMLTECFVPGWYAGSCRRCDAGTYVVPGLTWVTCGVCSSTTHVGDHLEVVLTEARGWQAPPKRIAEAVVALVDTELSVPRLYDRIRQWAQRGLLEPVHHTTRDYSWDEGTKRFVVTDQPTGRARYRLGDVLDLVLRDTKSLTTNGASA